MIVQAMKIAHGSSSTGGSNKSKRKSLTNGQESVAGHSGSLPWGRSLATATVASSSLVGSQVFVRLLYVEGLLEPARPLLSPS